MRKVAAHKVYFTQRDYLINQIVEITNSNILAIRELRHEEAMTEWLSGVIVLTDKSDLNVNSINKISDFFTDDNHVKSTTIYAWHIADFDHDSELILTKNISLIT